MYVHLWDSCKKEGHVEHCLCGICPPDLLPTSLLSRSPNGEQSGEKEGCSAWRVFFSLIFNFFLKDRKLEHKNCHMHAGQIFPMRLPSAELEPLVEMIESQIFASLKKKKKRKKPIKPSRNKK